MHLNRFLRKATSLSALTAAAFAATVAIGAPLASPAGLRPAGFVVTAGIRMNSFEARLLNLVNQARTERGLVALIPTAGTTDVARAWSGHLAATNTLAHNPALVSDLEHAGSPDWNLIAENVGVGPANDPDLMFAAYMNSPHHRDNILDPGARYVGSGVVERPGAGAIPTAFHTMDFVDHYTAAYGSNRLAAAGLRVDAVVLPMPAVIGTFQTGSDPRVDTTAAGAMTASRATFDRPGPGDLATRFTAAEPYRATGGYAQLRVKDAYDFRLLGHLTVTLSAAAPNARPVDVTVSLSESWSTFPNVILGTVHVGPHAQTFTFAIPAAGRTFRNQITFSVSAASITALSPLPAGRHANVAVFGISAAG